MKRTLSLTLTLCLTLALFVPFAALPASAETEGIYTYSIYNNEATVTDCTESASGAITIPDTLGGYPVVAIGNYAFGWRDLLTSVTIPASVTSIGNNAFQYCSSLTSITIPESVTSIGNLSFEYCSSLTSVTIPDSVTSIGYRAFFDCRALTAFTVDSENDYYTAEDGVLFNKDKTTLVQYPIGNTRTAYTIPEGVTSIGDDAFYGCTALTSITIPTSVTSIGWGAFEYCSSLTSITIPEGVTRIEGLAFSGCNALTAITVEPENENYMSEDGVLFTKDKTTLVQYPVGNPRTTYTVPESVTSIGNLSFEYCSSLTSITIPYTVTYIEWGAFKECPNLTIYGYEGSEAQRYANQKSIPFVSLGRAPWEYLLHYSIWNGEATITRCDTSVSGAIDIPATLDGYPVVAIGQYAFSGCSSLTSITIPASVTSIGMDAFGKTAWYENQPDGVLYLDGWVLGYKGKMPEQTTLTLREGTRGIADYAFYQCTALTAIAIPESVITIGSGAFHFCYSLTSVSFGENSQLTSIADSTFAGCSFTSIIIPNSVTSIGENAFGKTALTSVTIPGSVTRIESLAFYACGSLAAITIPASVTDIGEEAFLYCDNLTIYGYEGTTAQTYANENNIPFVAISLSITAEHGTVSVQIGNAAAVQVDSKSGFAPAAGETITLTATGTNAFKFWKNARSGTVVSTNETLSFAFGGSELSLVAVFAAEEAPGEADTYTVYFRDSMTGKIVSSMDVAKGYEIAASDLPAVSFVGYTLTGWKIGSLDALGYKVTRTAVALSQYEKDPDAPTYRLTIDREPGRYPPSTTSRAFNRVAILQNFREDFSGWKIGGTLVSMDRHYVFGMPSQDVTIVGVYNEPTPEALAEVIGLSNINNTLYFTMSRSVKEGYTILETGTLLTRKATADDLTVSSTLKTVTKTISTAPESYDVIGFRKDASTKPGTWLVRGYVTVQNRLGEVKTYYTDISTVVVA